MLHDGAFARLADTKAELLNSMGVGQSEPKDITRKIFRSVMPQEHEKEVLEDIKKLS